VIISKNVLWVLAEAAPKSLADMQGIVGLGPWRLSNYGTELLEVLQKNQLRSFYRRQHPISLRK
jgi:hypothetical protein